VADKQSGMSNNLLNAIRQGQQLKPVDSTSDMRIDPANFKDEGVLSGKAQVAV
jgi:hypothetical protein